MLVKNKILLLNPVCYSGGLVVHMIYLLAIGTLDLYYVIISPNVGGANAFALPVTCRLAGHLYHKNSKGIYFAFNDRPEPREMPLAPGSFLIKYQ